MKPFGALASIFFGATIARRYWAGASGIVFAVLATKNAGPGPVAAPFGRHMGDRTTDVTKLFHGLNFAFLWPDLFDGVFLANVLGPYDLLGNHHAHPELPEQGR